MAGDDAQKARWQDKALAFVTAVTFIVMGLAVYLGFLRDDAEDVTLERVEELVVEVRTIAEQNRRLTEDNQRLVDFVSQVMTAHRCEAAEGFDQVLETLYQRQLADNLDNLCP